MRELSNVEISNVSGTGTLAEPISNPGSELGRAINDIARALNEFGSWLGQEIGDVIDSIPVPPLPTAPAKK